MFAIKSVILFLVLGVNISNQASVSSMVDPSENNTVTNKNLMKSDKNHKQTTQFPPIDPNLHEDAKLTVV